MKLLGFKYFNFKCICIVLLCLSHAIENVVAMTLSDLLLGGGRVQLPNPVEIIKSLIPRPGCGLHCNSNENAERDYHHSHRHHHHHNHGHGFDRDNNQFQPQFPQQNTYYVEENYTPHQTYGAPWPCALQQQQPHQGQYMQVNCVWPNSQSQPNFNAPWHSRPQQNQPNYNPFWQNTPQIMQQNIRPGQPNQPQIMEPNYNPSWQNTPQITEQNIRPGQANQPQIMEPNYNPSWQNQPNSNPSFQNLPQTSPTNWRNPSQSAQPNQPQIMEPNYKPAWQNQPNYNPAFQNLPQTQPANFRNPTEPNIFETGLNPSSTQDVFRPAQPTQDHANIIKNPQQPIVTPMTQEEVDNTPSKPTIDAQNETPDFIYPDSSRYIHKSQNSEIDATAPLIDIRRKRASQLETKFVSKGL